MRGRDLGQYFTPRTLVKLGVRLGDLKPTDRVLDGCCGTGGFLIDALSDMWTKVNRNESLSDEVKATERKAIADDRIYGIDFAKDPNLAKIARLNMYLHGDGASRIFNVDSLDSSISDVSGDTRKRPWRRKRCAASTSRGRSTWCSRTPHFLRSMTVIKRATSRLKQYSARMVGKKSLPSCCSSKCTTTISGPVGASCR